MSVPKSMALPDGVRFVIDSREQLPYLLQPSVVKALPSGDYSVEGLEESVVVERKSLADMLSCITSSRDRFERELERLASYRYAALLIEANARDLASRSFAFTAVHPSAVLGSLFAWSFRFKLHVWLAGTRTQGEMFCERLLCRAYHEVTESK